MSPQHTYPLSYVPVGNFNPNTFMKGTLGETLSPFVQVFRNHLFLLQCFLTFSIITMP